MRQEIINSKRIIIEELEKKEFKVERVLLFGSRARNDFHKDSDWDFYVTIDREIDRDTKWDILLNIKRKLVKLNIPNDVIIESKNKFYERKGNVGYITYYALKEGIQI